MTFMMWTVAVIVALTLGTMLLLTLTAGSRNRSVVRLATAVGLGVPDSLKNQLAARNTARTIAVSTGGLLGTAVIIAAVQLGVIPTSNSTESAGDLWMLLGATIAGMAIGATIAALRTRPVIPEGQRVARSGAVALEDYLAPVELLGARVASGLGAVTLIAACILLFTGVIDATPALLVGGLVIGLGLAGLVMFEIVARRILSRALPVGSPAELAWNDALRARAMRDVASLPLCLGVWGTLAVLLAIAATASLTLIASITAVAVFLGICAAAAVSIATRPQQHFLRRLWPDVAARRAGTEVAA